MAEPNITAKQWLDPDGSFQAVVTFEGPGTLTLSVYPDTVLTNGLQQIVGYAYAKTGPLTEEDDPVTALDADVVEPI